MFENILFQDLACSELRQAIHNGTLPPASLIYGPPLAGKTTLALELARVLTCQNPKAQGERGKWTCACWSCQQQRELAQEQVLLMGGSDFAKEIQVCRHFLDLGWRNQLAGKHKRILLLVWLRSLAKVLKRYDKPLWQENKTKSDKERKAQKALEEFVELLAKLRPSQISSADSSAEAASKAVLPKKELDRCQELADILIAAIPQGIPIQQIRQLQQWSCQTSETGKVAILENIEAMNPAATNAMLKLLEEPPQGCHFVLTVRRRQALPATILSRLRQLRLRQRSRSEEQQIANRVFRSPDSPGLGQLFLSGKRDSQTMQSECQLFLQALREHRPFFTIRKHFDKMDLEPFLQNLGLLLQRECCQQHQRAESLQAEHNFSWYQRFLQLGSAALERHRVYHDSAPLLLQSLYLELLSEG